MRRSRARPAADRRTNMPRWLHPPWWYGAAVSHPLSAETGLFLGRSVFTLWAPRSAPPLRRRLDRADRRRGTTASPWMRIAAVEVRRRDRQAAPQRRGRQAVLLLDRDPETIRGPAHAPSRVARPAGRGECRRGRVLARPSRCDSDAHGLRARDRRCAPAFNAPITNGGGVRRRAANGLVEQERRTTHGRVASAEPATPERSLWGSPKACVVFAASGSVMG